MSERAPKSSKKPIAAKSGEHPTVIAYRAKLDSVNEGTAKATSKLDHDLQEFLMDLKTPVPSGPPTPVPSK